MTQAFTSSHNTTLQPGMLKRKRDANSDEDEPSFGRQILPVANLPEDFNEVPMDGLEYLFTVRRDARYLPHVTRAINPYEFPEPEPAPLKDESPKKSHHALPSRQWREAFEKHFRYFRKNITQPTIHVGISSHDPGHKLMPNMRERDCWWAFLSGKSEIDWNPPKILKQASKLRPNARFGRMRGYASDSGSDPDEDSVPAEETWIINDEGEVELTKCSVKALPTPSSTPDDPLLGDEDKSPSTMQPRESRQPEPTPSLLHLIDHRMSLHLLMYFTHWMNIHIQRPEQKSHHLTGTHARWIFALLSKVEEHISADDMSLLRSLVRACLSLLRQIYQGKSYLDGRKNVQTPAENGDGSDEAIMGGRACWMIITAVIVVWGQKDLWIDAEAMLKGLPS